MELNLILDDADAYESSKLSEDLNVLSLDTSLELSDGTTDNLTLELQLDVLDITDPSEVFDMEGNTLQLISDQDDGFSRKDTLIRTRERAVSKITDTLNDILNFYYTAFFNSINPEKLIEQQIGSRFKKLDSSGMAQVLESAPKEVTHDFKMNLSSINALISTGIQSGYSEEYVIQYALRALQTEWSKVSSVQTQEIETFFITYVNACVDYINQINTSNTISQARIESISSEYTRDIRNTMSCISDIKDFIQSGSSITDVLGLVSEITTEGSTIMLKCECGCSIVLDNYVHLFYLASRKPNVFLPLEQCPSCCKYIALTKHEIDLLKTYLVKNYSLPEDMPANIKGITAGYPSVQVYSEVLPHITTTVTKSTNKTSSRVLDDLYPLLSHIPPYLERMEYYASQKNSVEFKIASTEQDLGSIYDNIKYLSKYLSTIYGANYSKLKECATSTILEGFTDDPVLSQLLDSVHQYKRDGLISCIGYAHKYDVNHTSSYFWLYNQIGVLTGIPFTNSVSVFGIYDNDKFKSYSDDLENFKLSDYISPSVFKELTRYFTFRKIELKELDYNKYKEVLSNTYVYEFLDRASDLMVLNNVLGKFFEDYNKIRISVSNITIKSALKSKSLSSILTSVGESKRCKSVASIAHNIKKAANLMKNTSSGWDKLSNISSTDLAKEMIFSYYSDINDLRAFQALFYGLQTNDEWLIQEGMKLCSYILHSKKYNIFNKNRDRFETFNGLPGSYADSLRKIIQPTEAPPMTYEDLVTNFYTTKFKHLFPTDEMMEALSSESRIFRFDSDTLPKVDNSDFKSFLSAIEDSSKTYIPRVDPKYYTLYIHIYGIITYFYGLLHKESNEPNKYLLFDLIWSILPFGDVLYHILSIDKSVFSNIVTQVTNSTFYSNKMSDEEELCSILSNSVSLNPDIQDLCARASAVGVHSNLALQEEDFDVISVDSTKTPITEKDANTILAVADFTIAPKQTKILVRKLWDIE